MMKSVRVDSDYMVERISVVSFVLELIFVTNEKSDKIHLFLLILFEDIHEQFLCIRNNGII